MIDTNELESLTVEGLRAGIALQRKEIDRLRQENAYLLKDRKTDADEIHRLRAQLASRGGVPEGWKLVPEEAVREIREACDIAMRQTVSARVPECGEFGRIAQTLAWVCDRLAAAPSPEGQEAGSIDPEKLRVALEQAGMRLIQMEGGRLSLEKATPIYARPTHPAPAEGQAGEREAFEQAAEAMGFDLSVHWGQPGNNFESDDTRLGYEIWQKAWRAALAAQQQEGRGRE